MVWLCMWLMMLCVMYSHKPTLTCVVSRSKSCGVPGSSRALLGSVNDLQSSQKSACMPVAIWGARVAVQPGGILQGGTSSPDPLHLVLQ